MAQIIAFVDDEQNVLESLKWVFKDEPYEIFVFTDPFELLARLSENEFAVVVADQVMPEIEGIALLQLVKEKSPATVCIIMTAHADLKIAIDAMNKGNIFRFVFKPWDIVEIKTAVKNAVDLYELKSEIRRLWQLTRNQNEQLLELNRKLKDKVDEQSEEIKQTEEERKELEAQLIQSQKMEAMGTLASGIAHDFNNILAGIVGYSEVATLIVEDNPQIKGIINKILEACERAKALINQILSFSRERIREREEKPVNIGPIIQEVIKLLKASIPDNIEIAEIIHDNSGFTKADPTKIHQILMNLCTNSIHAMKENGGILKIELSHKDLDANEALFYDNITPGNYLRLSISDTGHGMPDSIKKRIFDPYFTTKEKGEGTGLGLAVVHGIIKNYKGTISVESALGKGTTFDVFFPVINNTGSSNPDN
jgi:signal transduction histidine kinase